MTEADGSVSTFKVPFSAVAESLRPNISRYSLLVGKTRYVGDSDLFGEASYRRGISNAITANSAFRLADGYQAAMLGGVYTSQLGALGSIPPILAHSYQIATINPAGCSTFPTVKPTVQPVRPSPLADINIPLMAIVN